MVNTIILESSIKPHTKWALAECLMCVESEFRDWNQDLPAMFFIRLFIEDLGFKGFKFGDNIIYYMKYSYSMTY